MLTVKSTLHDCSVVDVLFCRCPHVYTMSLVRNTACNIERYSFIFFRINTEVLLHYYSSVLMVNGTF